MIAPDCQRSLQAQAFRRELTAVNGAPNFRILDPLLYRQLYIWYYSGSRSRCNKIQTGLCSPHLLRLVEYRYRCNRKSRH